MAVNNYLLHRHGCHRVLEQEACTKGPPVLFLERNDHRVPDPTTADQDRMSLRDRVLLLLANASEPRFDAVTDTNRLYLELNHGQAVDSLLACYELTERSTT